MDKKELQYRLSKVDMMMVDALQNLQMQKKNITAKYAKSFIDDIGVKLGSKVKITNIHGGEDYVLIQGLDPFTDDLHKPFMEITGIQLTKTLKVSKSKSADTRWVVELKEGNIVLATDEEDGVIIEE